MSYPYERDVCIEKENTLKRKSFYCNDKNNIVKNSRKRKEEPVKFKHFYFICPKWKPKHCEFIVTRKFYCNIRIKDNHAQYHYFLYTLNGTRTISFIRNHNDMFVANTYNTHNQQVGFTTAYCNFCVTLFSFMSTFYAILSISCSFLSTN